VKKLTLFLCLLPLALLQACGHGNGNGTTSVGSGVRFINASYTDPKLDATIIGAAQPFNGLETAQGNVVPVPTSTDPNNANNFPSSNYTNVTTNNLAGGTILQAPAVTLNTEGTTTQRLTGSYSLQANINYTAIIYNNAAGALAIAPISDSGSIPASGNAGIRIINLTTSGTYYYFDKQSADFTAFTNTNRANLGSAVTGYTTINDVNFQNRTSCSDQANTGNCIDYHLRVTATGSSGVGDQVLLDLPNIHLHDTENLTIVLVDTNSGALINALELPQGITATPVANTSARIRVVTNFNQNSVTAGSPAVVNVVDVSGSTQLSNSPSPISQPVSYSNVLITNDATVSTSTPLGVTVNGNPVCSSISTVGTDGTVTPNSGGIVTTGQDITLLLLGDPANPECYLLQDDNSLPTDNFVRVRLVNGASVSTVPGTVSLWYNSGFTSTGATGVARGGAKYATVSLQPSDLAAQGGLFGLLMSVTNDSNTLAPIAFANTDGSDILARRVYTLVVVNNPNTGQPTVIRMLDAQ
jgi:hypothetical protein